MLHAVISERSVTRAAVALHVTPSAVSNALARLRATFEDPLLVRSGRGLVLTPRAAALAPQLADAVSAMARVVEEQSNFEPTRTTRTFALACSDAEQVSEVPRMAAAFSRKLPNARLRVMSVDQLEAKGGLAGGEVDAAIAPAFGAVRDVYSSDLYQEEGVLVVRKGHPHVRGGRMSKDQFNALRHVPSVSFRIQLLWHERTHADAGARFFRSLVVAAVGRPTFQATAAVKPMAIGRIDRSV